MDLNKKLSEVVPEDLQQWFLQYGHAFVEDENNKCIFCKLPIEHESGIHSFFSGFAPKILYASWLERYNFNQYQYVIHFVQALRADLVQMKEKLNES